MYKNLCKKLKIKFKTDLITTVTIFVVMLGAGILCAMAYNLTIGIMIATLSLFYVYMHFANMNTRLVQLTYAKEIAFNGFYRYVISLLSSGHILYSALKASVEYVDPVLLDDVNELIANIEDDTTMEPFIEFMGNFRDDNIKQMVILLYKTGDSGNVTDVIESINECMVNLQDNAIKEYVNKESKKILSYYFVPVILSALAIIVLTMYVFSNIGGEIYV